MPFQLKNSSNHQIIHANEWSGNDFNTEQLIENKMNFDLPFAEANISEWYFNGIRINHQVWQYKDRVAMDWKADLDMVTLYFNLKGNTSIGNKHFNKPFELGRNQHNLFYAQSGEGTIKNEDFILNSFMIQFNRNTFLKLIADANDVLKRFGDHVLAGKTSALSENSLHMDIQMLSAINAVIHCNYQPRLKKLLFISKCLELLVLQAEAYNRISEGRNSILKTEYDKERIIYARDFLIEHLGCPPSLMELSKIAGINEYKLKKGFKEIFGNTVFGYLTDTRLELAKTDLMERRKSTQELAFELGYGSVQHFGTAFKKKFGVSPGKVNK